MAKTIKVLPLPDGTSLRGNWQVQVSGARKSKHTSKGAAKRKARRYASEGDRLVIYRKDGTIQSDVTIQGGGGGGSGGESFDLQEEYEMANDVFDIDEDDWP